MADRRGDVERSRARTPFPPPRPPIDIHYDGISASPGFLKEQLDDRLVALEGRSPQRTPPLVVVTAIHIQRSGARGRRRRRCR